MKFTKMHGAGNDYIYVDCFKENVVSPKETAIFLSKAHFGVGADGLVLIKRSPIAHCFMDIYNADGSRAKMCGNAIRCVAHYVYHNISKESTLYIDTLSGVKTVTVTPVTERESFCCVDMGSPVLAGHQIPTRYGKSIVKDESIYILDREYKITCLSMGNPHCVIFCDDNENLPLSQIGEVLENHYMFPEGVNTELVTVCSDNSLKMRVWERGSGETLSCGTGACASAVASVLNGYSKENSPVSVISKGGILTVNWQNGSTVMLSGSATYVFSGEI